MSPPLAPVLRSWLEEGLPAIAVSIAEAHGSTPREAGAALYVAADRLCGTIGGGRLELDAIERARRMLAEGVVSASWEVPLGPEIGQCCGGRVRLDACRLDREQVLLAQARDSERGPLVLLFGAGHVGRSLARALATLPFRVRWIDERAEEFSRDLGEAVEIAVTNRWEAEIAAAPAGSACVVMTHTHALDSLVTAAALERGDFAYVGLIGSLTKRRRFERAYRELGMVADSLARLTCPIGDRGIRDKRPEVIAALTAAELIEVFARSSSAAA